MALSQIQRDLNQYAQGKAHKLILDVVQTFEIADQRRSDAFACIGSTFLRIAATMALYSNADRERWMAICNEVFELAKQAKEETDNDDEAQGTA